MYAALDSLARQASWTFSIFKEGPPDQHYPLESIVWTNGSPQANIKFIGEEHEGVAGEELNGNQILWTARITSSVRELCPRVKANPPQRRINLWEHNELTIFGASPTACPSGRIPWAKVIAEVEGIPPIVEEGVVEMFLVYSVNTNPQHVYVIGPAGKRHIDDANELRIYKNKLGPPVGYNIEELNFVPDMKED
mgnify:FL=1